MSHKAWSGLVSENKNQYRHVSTRKIKRLIKTYADDLAHILRYGSDEQRILEVTFQIEQLNEELDSRH